MRLLFLLLISSSAFGRSVVVCADNYITTSSGREEFDKIVGTLNKKLEAEYLSYYTNDGKNFEPVRAVLKASKKNVSAVSFYERTITDNSKNLSACVTVTDL